MFECSNVRKLFVISGDGVEGLFIQMSQRVRVSLQNQGQIVIGLVVLFGVGET